MKTKFMKRTLSAMLATSMTIGLFGAVSVFANNETETAADPTPQYLYYEDFEGQTVDSAPTGIYSGTANELYTQENKTALSVENASVKSDSTQGIGKYLEIKPYTSSNAADNSSGGAKIFLSEPMGKEDGTIVLEYDGLINLVNNQDGSKRVSVNKLVTTKDSINLETTQILNHKGVDRNSVMGSDNTHGFSLTKYNPDADTAAGEKKNTDTGLLSYDGQSLMLRENNAWNHYKFEFNLNDGTVTLWLNGKISETWTNQAVLQIAKAYKLESFIFQNFNYESWTPKNETSWKLDNIKVYKKDAKGVSPFESIAQDNLTGVVTATFNAPMSEDGIGLYDANGKEVTKTVTLSDDKKSVSIKPSESTNGLYYVKVKKYEGGTPVAQGEKTVELNWKAAPSEYLYYEDFESQEVDSAPTGIYKGEAINANSLLNKTAMTTDDAQVKKDAENTNKYLEIQPHDVSDANDNSLGGAAIIFDTPLTKDDGTIVLEYDGLIESNSVEDDTKRLSLSKFYSTGNDVSYHSTVQILSHKRGSDLNSKRFALVAKGVSDPIDMTSLNDKQIMNWNKGEWNHYKLEIKLGDNGYVTGWVNGKISEQWQNEGARQVSVSYKLESFIFQNFNSTSWSAKNTTPWKLDNIKIYRKDSSETSPFSTDEITSKDGTVRFKTDFAVNEDDISIYNADGEKQDGEITVAADKKSVQFVPSNVMKEGRYYIKLAKLASEDVTPQTEKEFEYKPGKTKTTISIGDVRYTKDSVIKPTINVEHNSGKSVTLRLIIAAYKDGRMIQAVTGEWGHDGEDYKGEITGVPELTLSEAADTIKAFAWDLSNLAPTGIADVKTSVSTNE